MRNFSFIVCSTASLLCVGSVLGQWSVTNLHPTGFVGSTSLSGGAGTQQIGNSSSAAGASVWNGTRDSYASLPVSVPSGFLLNGSTVTGISNGSQVGYVQYTTFNPLQPTQQRAVKWNGPGTPMVDLNAGEYGSIILGAGGNQGAGAVMTPASTYAATWDLTTHSHTVLTATSGSLARATDGVQQVGYTNFFAPQAAMWSGSFGSEVNLHPSGAVSSDAYGVHAGRQVGSMTFASNLPQAVLWSGTAASALSLHPAGATESTARGILDNMQVGEARVSGVYRASLWNNTAASWTDLGALLPVDFTDSFATAIYNYEGTVYITGRARRASTGVDEAILWSQPIPSPSGAVALGLGLMIASRRRR